MWQEILPGETKKLAIVDQQTHYKSAGNQATSRQYYLNPAGYGARSACRWGSEAEPLGNWAPLNIGLGWATNNRGYFSMFNNAPTQKTATLGYNVKITGGDAECNYDNHYITYRDKVAKATGPTADGCTVGVMPKANVVFNLTP
jgi:hypothetical protein